MHDLYLNSPIPLLDSLFLTSFRGNAAKKAFRKAGYLPGKLDLDRMFNRFRYKLDDYILDGEMEKQGSDEDGDEEAAYSSP